MHRPALVPFLLVTLVGAASEAAAALRIVDGFGVGGTYATIQQAVDASADGDVVLVKGGVYDAFVVDGKGITVTIEPGLPNLARVRVHPQIPMLTIRNLSPSQSVTVRGIEFGHYATVPGQPPPFQGADGVVLRQNLGPIVLEAVRVSHAGTFDPLVVDRCASVTLARCESHASTGRHALVLEQSTAFVHDSFLFGGGGTTTDLSIPPSDGGDGVRVVGGELLLSGGITRGGDGVNNTFDFQTLGCTPASDGGHGVHLFAGSPVVRTLGGQLVGGVGGVDASHTICTLPPGADGLPVRVASGQHVVLPETPRAFSLGSAEREGLPLPLALGGAAHDLVVLFVGADHAVGPYLPSVHGPLLPAAPSVAFTVGTLPANGELAFDVFVPSLPAGVDAVPIVAQPAFLFTGPGSGIVMGPPSVTTLLDALVP